MSIAYHEAHEAMSRPRYELTGARSAPDENFTLLCHSEESSDEESAFDFSVLIEGIGKSAKQMLHGVYPETAEGFSMTQQQTLNTSKIPFTWRPLRLCASHCDLIAV